MTSNDLRPAEELAALIRTKCLTDAGHEAPRRKLAITAKNSPHRAEIEAEIAEVESRWLSEEPVRAARAALAAAGWKQSCLPRADSSTLSFGRRPVIRERS